MDSRAGFDPIILAILFVAAVIIDGVVLYLVEPASTRLLFGLLVLLPIMWPVVWATRHFGVIGRVTQKVQDQAHKRRYNKLRTQVELLLEEVKRLNWLAVDVNRGFRKKEDTAAEVEAIKHRLMEIVEKMPAAAGAADTNVVSEKAESSSS